jgi:hypothetical protein
VKVRGRFAIAACAAFLAGCGGPATAPIVIARTPEDAPAGTERAAVDALVARDAEAAVAALDGAAQGEGDPASLAAVYALRLGVRRDSETIRAAVRRGTGSADALVAALCWRWIGAGAFGDPPAFATERPADPAVAALAAAAFVRLGRQPPGPLAGALGLPEKGPSDRDPPPPAARVETLRRAAFPYDDGPLALAVAFVEARRERWVEDGPGGGPELVASKLRVELVTALGGDDGATAHLSAAAKVRDPLYSTLTARLAAPLAGAPLPVLRGAIVKGDPKLRVDALRALALAVSKPEAGDLGAAAAAIGSGDPLTRVEAARTYLLLAARATE